MNQLLAMRAFVRLVETGSFSRTADHLALPRSTVSKLIIDLEKHLGTKLLNRTTRAVAATSDGLEYYSHAARLIAEVDSVDRALRGKKVKPGGHLRIDAPASFATCLLIPALDDFHREYPDITIALVLQPYLVRDAAVGLILQPHVDERRTSWASPVCGRAKRHDRPHVRRKPRKFRDVRL